MKSAKDWNMRWKPVRDRPTVEQRIAAAFERRLERVEVPPYPHFDFHEVEGHPQRNNRRVAWRMRAANLAFALFFVCSFSILAVNREKSSDFAAYLVPRAARYRLGELLPHTLDIIQRFIAPGLIGGRS